MIDQQPRIQSLFATPLWRLQWPASLSESLERIATQVAADVSNGDINSSLNKSNILGSQSRRCRLRDSPYLQDAERNVLLGMFRSVLPLENNFMILTWMNCSPVGSHNTAHVHPGAEISGVFYIAVPPGSGQIVFRDPRPQSEMSRLHTKDGKIFKSQAPRFSVSPTVGNLLLFPSWLMHHVEPGTDQEGLRISMAFNINGLREAQ